MRVKLKTKEELLQDPEVRFDQNEFYTGTDTTLTEDMFYMLGETIDVEEDFGVYYTDDGYSIQSWMVKEFDV